MGLTSKVRIEIDGKDIMDFVEFRIRQHICAHHEFEVKCRKETFEEHDTFLLEKSKRFIGAEIKIEIEGYTQGYKNSKPAFFFKGLITDVKATKSGLSENDYILISGFSPDILLQDNPGCNSFLNLGLKQIVDKVFSPYPKDLLRTQVKPNNNSKHAFTVQYNESRYDFVKRLATRFGEWFYYDGTELVFGNPASKSTELCLGEDLYDFAFSIRVNPLNFNYVSYNPSKGDSVSSSSNKSTGAGHLNEYGNFALQKSMKLFNQNSVSLYNHLATEESGYASESAGIPDLKGGGIALGMSAATGKSHNPEVKIGGQAVIKALKDKDKGKVDYGEYRVTSITHYCDNLRNYSNEFVLLPSKAKIPDYTDPLAFPRSDPQYARVTNNNDPDKLGRVKVRFFWQTNGAETPWIRIARAHAGSDAGFYIIPEVDEEVMVGFESGDAEKPYVIGSLYNGKQKPAGSWGSEGNDFKAIRTRSGNTIELIDKKGKEEIIIYQENDKSAAHHISLTAGSDPTLSIFSKGKLVIEAKSIEIKSSGEIKMTANQDLSVKGMNKVNLESGMNMDVKSGMDMDVKAETNLNLEGGVNVNSKAGLTNKMDGTMAEVQGSTSTTIKGAIVLIN